jgi:hypothetical protein
MSTETPITNTKGLAFDFGQSTQDIDQSVNYNFEGAGSEALNFSKILTPTVMYALLAVAAIVVIAMVRSRK